jgi:hypothetical protein
MGQRFRDYSHFCEYQTAIRDFIEDVNFLDPTFVILKNAEMLEKPFNLVEAAFDVIKSFAHIAKDQFFKIAKLYCEDYEVVNLYKY